MIHETVTPTGLSIVFEDGEEDPVTGKSKKRAYTVNGLKLPSVTTILGLLEKKALQFAAEKITAQACVDLARDGDLPLTGEAAVSRLASRKLRFYQQWERKADLGQLTHADLLALVTGDELADTTGLSPEAEGMLRGAADWFADHRPTAIDTECMVASVEHGFAGRHDFFGEVLGYPGKTLVDYKSTHLLPRYKNGSVKPPFDENVIQLGLYEIARRESGYEPSDRQLVVRIDSTGAHETTLSWISPEDALDLLPAYRLKQKVAELRPKWNAKAAA